MKKFFYIMILAVTLLLAACSDDIIGREAGKIDAENSTFVNQRGEEVNIAVTTPITISENLIQLNGVNVYLRLKMINGEYYEDWSPKTISGTVWEGEFIFEVSDESGKVMEQTYLNSYYTKPLIFTDRFSIEFDDYNNDGNLDFTLGQYSLNSVKSYRLFTVKNDGMIEELIIKDTPELFINAGGDIGGGGFSIKLAKHNNSSFKTRHYNSDTGKTYESIYEWRTDKFISVDIREIMSLEGYHEIMSDDLLLPKEMLAYIRGNIGHALESDAVNLVLRLETLQKNYLDQLTEKYFSNDEARDELIKLGTIPVTADGVKNRALRELLADTYSNGFKTETAEGDYFPVIDYQIYKEFSEYLPKDLQDYIQLMAVESAKAPAKDGALVIEWDEVVRRAYSQQQFIVNNPKSQKLEEVQELFGKYVSFIFNGLPNTPYLNRDTKTLNTMLREALTNISTEKGDTLLEKKISDYLEVLDKNGYKMSAEVEQFRIKAVEDLTTF